VSSLSDRVAGALERHGKTLQLVKSGSTYSSAARATTPGTDTTYTVMGRRQNYELREIDGTEILSTDAKYLVSSGGLPASFGPGEKGLWTLTDGTARFTLESIKSHELGGTTAYFWLQARPA
jgi:hypothetical protein